MTAIVLGNFDGCHLGHVALFKALKQEAKKSNTEPLAISFEPHTRHIIQGAGYPELLTCSEEKRNLFASYNIPFAFIEFNRDLFSMPFSSFVKEFIIKKYKATTWVLGLDQRFGRGGKGNAESLKAYFPSLNIYEINPVVYNNHAVSSSKIRESLKEGDLGAANSMLGRNYSLTGIVEHGLGQGRLLGFPTANLQLPLYKLLPSNGVYSGFVSFEKQKLRAVINIGTRPSLGNRTVGLEAHILNFDEDLYGKKLSVELTKRLRDEIKFESVDALKEQIKKDIYVAYKDN